ncbi:ATP-dependent DNA helicase srs2 [Sporothrix epigloea]|uniref:DNA 3'-5' helicase n=1 Tax=Sporothrix epigloea TaxID=1892477 RepID=A0ABP0D2Y4_9PEZI
MPTRFQNSVTVQNNHRLLVQEENIGVAKMGPEALVIDLCSDSDADSGNGFNLRPQTSQSRTARASDAVTTTRPVIERASAALLKKVEATATLEIRLPLAPIFRRNAASTSTSAISDKTRRPRTDLSKNRAESVRSAAVAKPTKQKKPSNKQNDQLPRTTDKRRAATPCGQPSGSIDIETLLDKLNAAQRRAVTSMANTVAILAGPGSGKTHTLTSRVAWLIDQVGYAPPNVIVATFTVKAAREMKERIGRVLGGGREKKIVLGTFHSLSLRYLSAYGTRIGIARGFSIVDDGDAKAILKRIIQRLNLTLEPAMAKGYISKKKSKGCLGVEDNRVWKMMGKTARAGQNDEAAHSDDITTKLEAVRSEYQKHLQSLNLLDFDDLLIRCTDLLRAYPACVTNVQAVLIDEYQDTNGIQFELMKLFAQHCHRITVVGDPDQSIYGWRSAEITNLIRFLSDYPQTAEIALEENYRSSRCILHTSLQVIQQDHERYDKSLLPIHKKGTLPVLRRLQDAPSEARWIVQEIQRATLLSGNMLHHGDVAILVRSAASSRPIEQALARAGLPYRMIGGRRFFERAEVRLLVDYLRIIDQSSNNDVLARIINVPRRGIGPKTIQKLLEEAETNKMSLWTLITKHCRGERQAEAGITAPAEKKISRFIGLIQRMQHRLNGTVVEEQADQDESETEEADEVQQEKSKTTISTVSDAFDTAMDKPYNLVELITALQGQLDYRKYIGETFGGDEEARWANVDEFVELAREFMTNAPAAMDEDELPAVDGMEQTKETSVLHHFLANISLAADADKKKEEEESASQVPMVTISTIHAAKGLEWPVVFIPTAYEGSLPHSRSDDINEERRLLYVAMTRAKCLLNVSYSLFGLPDRNKESSGRRSEQCISPYLAGIVDTCFAERGPSFDSALLEELGDILGRAVPSHSEIYKNMSLPANVPLEDEVFPLDPLEESRYRSGDEEGDGEYGGRYRRPQEKMAKRRKIMDAPEYDTSGGPRPWQRGYATTMESGAASFTMGSTAYPGFTTASAHRAAQMVAEAAEVARRAEHDANQRMLANKDKRRRAALTSGQQTIMQSFTRSNSTISTTTPALPLSPVARISQRSSFCLQQSASGIPDELKGHSLGAIKGNKLPKSTENEVAAPSESSAVPEGNKRKQYAHFSSSPARADVQHVQDQSMATELSDVLHGAPPPIKLPRPFDFNPPRPYRAKHRPTGDKENMVLSNGRSAAGAMEGLGTATDISSNAMSKPRPAASLHTTSMAQVQPQDNACRRPTGNRMGGTRVTMVPMAKLCKPFKPPSIVRPH